ncbi:MAG: hypothetical protein CM1200mP30_08550 [Pseudomonadota bacterium]|nr:MAG: hypothetical protein CM1200mP30_08550 [Pseudomonadota bacterium]
MGCDANDIGSTIHPHPTLSETVALRQKHMKGQSQICIFLAKRNKVIFPFQM